jgi:membrane protease subunit HflC
MSKAWRIAIPVGVAVLLLLCFTCTFTHKPYEAPVVTRFGGIIDTSPIFYHLHLKLPAPIDHVRLIDQRLRSLHTRAVTYTLKSEQRQVGTEVRELGSEQLDITAFCHWHVTDPEKYVLTLHDDETVAQERLETKLIGELRGEVEERSLGEFFSNVVSEVKQEQMERRIVDRLNGVGGVGGCPEQFGVTIRRVGFYRIGFPKQVAQSIYAAMIAEQTQRATFYEERGKETAEQIRARAEGEAKIHVAESEAWAELIRRRADAESQKEWGDAIKKNPDLWRFLEGLRAAKESIRENSYVVLNVDEFPALRWLFDADSFRPDEPPVAAPTTRPASATP